MDQWKMYFSFEKHNKSFARHILREKSNGVVAINKAITNIKMTCCTIIFPYHCLIYIS